MMTDPSSSTLSSSSGAAGAALCPPSRTASPSAAASNFFASNFFSSGDFLNSLVTSSAASFFPTASCTSSASVGQLLARNSTKTLKCPKCNWHYKYQETLEIHMKEKHADQEVVCAYCVDNQPHPKLARGESYSCGYKPYRCELCKYSTTTKGNLSIHMQSDKHLHALQDIPQSLAAAAGPSQLLLGQFGHPPSSGAVTSSFLADLPPLASFAAGATAGALQCLVCLCFATDRPDEMVAHLDRDRGQPQEGDIAALHGFFQCLLCPYSTNLKANFQLHTRTDKHLQRVQLINHLREGSALLGPAEQFARLGSLKSAVQVRCQACQEIFSCIPSFRDHCLSGAHLQKMSSSSFGFPTNSVGASQEVVVPSSVDLLEHFLGNAIVRCGKCHWHGMMPSSVAAALDHSILHNGAGGEGAMMEAVVEATVGKAEEEATTTGWQEMDEFMVGAGLAVKKEVVAPMEDGRKRRNGDENNAAEEDGKTTPMKREAPIKCCPLCCSAEPALDLARHIGERHNIPAEIAQRLAQQECHSSEATRGEASVKLEPPSDGTSMAQASSPSSAVAPIIDANANGASSSSPTSSSSSPSSASASPIFRHSCPDCPLAFRSLHQLQAHALAHSPAHFRLVHRCADCGEEANSRAALDGHRTEKHPPAAVEGGGDAEAGGGCHFCDICQDGRRFDSDQALLAHFNSETHLQRICSGGGIEEREQQPSAISKTCSANPSPFPSSCKPATTLAPSHRRSNSANPVPKPLPYICNVCSLAFGQPGTLDTHLRSMAHAQRMAKLADLVQSGEVDPAKPVFEQPDPHPPQRSIGEAAKERKKQMGKLTMASSAQSQHPSASAQPPPHHMAPAPSLDMFKADQNQQQQQNNQMLQFMAQMFGGAAGQQDQQQQQTAFAQMAQMAQMMLSAQVAAAQMAAANAAAANGFGLLDMFSKPNGQENGIEMNGIGEPSPDEGPPKAKRARPAASSTPTQQQRCAAVSNGGSGRASREGSTAPSAPPAGLDLASVLQALASGSTPVSSSSSASSFPFMPPSTDPNHQFFMAMAAAAQQSTGAANSAAASHSTPAAASQQQQPSNAPSPSPQKRARTRIGDEQIKILRQYFDINNSPSEEQIKEMARRTQLGEKVIKHWFRNTLFKERQRDKDSPYNFSIPPQMGIDLATYHRTGEARIVPLVKQETKEEEAEKEEVGMKEEEEEKEVEGSGRENGGVEENGTARNDEGGEEDEGEHGKEATEAGGTKGGHFGAGQKEEPEEEEEEADGQQNDGGQNPQEEEDGAGEARQAEEEEEERTAAESMAAVAADLLANIGRQQFQQQQAGGAAAPSPLLHPFGCFPAAEQFAQMFSSAMPSFAGNPFGAAAFNPAAIFSATTGGASPFNPFGSTLQPQHSQQQSNPASSNSSAQSGGGGGTVCSGGPQMQQQNNATMGSGRRANRTRFTDFQLRTLQEFFDKQAYPKDDDLEMLSKKMGLSPRVIVVWFQNARQKARKVFEQQPHLMAAAAVAQQQQNSVNEQQQQQSAADPRFARTPSANFQCRACGQVFQRYLELIQHQQRVCFGAMEQQQEEGKAQYGEGGGAFLNGTGGKLEEEAEQRAPPLESTQEMLLRQLMGPMQEQMKACAAAECRPPAFHKRCPFCGLLFLSRDKLAAHLAQRHPEHANGGNGINLIDSLPYADEVPSAFVDLLQNVAGASNGAGGGEAASALSPLDLSVNAGGRMMNGGGTTTPYDAKDELAGFRSNEASLSPAAFSSSAGENDLLTVSQSCSPQLAALFQQQHSNFSSVHRPASSPQHSSGHNSNSAAAAAANKRFRTHLTPMQVFIMKSLFQDYKTPSMQECDLLGQKIGLHKRVIQVKFQNARAKERKAASGTGSVEPEEAVPYCCGSNQHCQLCDCPLANGQSVQEHIFSIEHIEKIRERGAQLLGIGGEAMEEGQPEKEHQEQRKGEAEEEDGKTPPPQQGDAISAAAAAQLGPLAQLPYFALAAAGLGQSGIPPLLYDPSLFGTPVPALKIPEAVAQQILMDMAERRERSKFTQDGMELADLEAKVPSPEDFQLADMVDLEVGWGCPQCGNVFQQPELLQNHQKLICPGADGGGTFRLVQTHYQCRCCRQRFGTQDDFCAHCQLEEHKVTRRRRRTAQQSAASG